MNIPRRVTSNTVISLLGQATTWTSTLLLTVAKEETKDGHLDMFDIQKPNLNLIPTFSTKNQRKNNQAFLYFICAYIYNLAIKSQGK